MSPRYSRAKGDQCRQVPRYQVRIALIWVQILWPCVLFRAMKHYYETAGHLGNSRRTRDALTILPRLEVRSSWRAEPRLVTARLQFEVRNRRVLRGSRSNRMSEVTSTSKCAAGRFYLPVSVHFREMLVSFLEKTFEARCAFIVTTLDHERTDD
jgi:hypothetical protein